MQDDEVPDTSGARGFVMPETAMRLAAEGARAQAAGLLPGPQAGRARGRVSGGPFQRLVDNLLLVRLGVKDSGAALVLGAGRFQQTPPRGH